MNLLNFISILSMIKIIPILLMLYIINTFLQETSTRKKFLTFLIMFIFFIILGVCLNLDGIIFLFIVSEIVVLLVFIVIFSQITSFSTQTPKKRGFLVILYFSILNAVLYDSKIISYKSFYSQQVYQLNDFFYFFNYYFEKQMLVTVFLILIITIYSLFFIMLYFTVKQHKLKETQTKNKIFALRKQNMLKQSIYSTKIRFFQK